MTDVLVQFHALPEELMPILHWAVDELSVHATAFRSFPFRAEEVAPNKLEVVLADSSIREIAFTLGSPQLPVAAQSEFLDRHLGVLTLDIGRLSKKGLNESCLSCRTSDAVALEVFRKIARKLRAMTKAGASVMNLTTGVAGRSRDHRYTRGAKTLDEKGVLMLPVAGGAVFHFGDAAKDGE